MIQHWREHPTVVAPLAEVEILRQDWLDAVISGSVDPDPGSVAMLVNLLAARQ